MLKLSEGFHVFARYLSVGMAVYLPDNLGVDKQTVGSAMEPNDHYLCIVPGRSAANAGGGKVFLPFEGDNTLSIILSKAMLLAEDQKIKDTTIISQIKG
jgi:hypothetical protein